MYVIAPLVTTISKLTLYVLPTTKSIVAPRIPPCCFKSELPLCVPSQLALPPLIDHPLPLDQYVSVEKSPFVICSEPS